MFEGGWSCASHVPEKGQTFFSASSSVSGAAGSISGAGDDRLVANTEKDIDPWIADHSSNWFR
jgi:hypothetical protein